MMSPLDALIAAVNGKPVPLLDIRQFIHIQRPHSSQLTSTTLSFRSITMNIYKRTLIFRHNPWRVLPAVTLSSRFSSCCDAKVKALKRPLSLQLFRRRQFIMHPRCFSCGRFCIACYETRASSAVINAN